MKALRIVKNRNENALKSFALDKKNANPNDKELAEVYQNAINSINGALYTESFVKAFDYASNHRDSSFRKVDNDKLEIALATIAQFDGACAKKLVDRINIEREFGHAISQPKLNLGEILGRAEVIPSETPAKEIFNYRNPFDKRMQNVKEIYEHLRDTKDPWYHKNGEKFTKMMQSMRNVLEYASTTKTANAKVIEAMLDDIKEKSKDYVLHKDANLGLGRDRRSAALAAVIALDADGGRELLHQVKEKSWVESFAKKLQMAPEHVERKDVLNTLNLSKPLNKEEILAKMSEDIARTKAEAANQNNNPEAGAEADKKDVRDVAAEVMVKERIYNSLKNKNVDSKAIIGYMAMSKKLVKEQSEIVLRDDVYRTVVNSMKLNNKGSYDKAINEIESQYIKARVEGVKAKEAAENKAAEHNRIEREMEANKKNTELNDSIGSIGSLGI